MSAPSAANLRAVGMAAIAVAGLPAAWNMVARNEYHRHTLERLLGGKHRGAYLLAAAIFFASLGRDAVVMAAMRANPSDRVLPVLPPTLFGESAVTALKAAGAALGAAGTALVLSSFLRLGVTGTYLGDYFGIRMKERVTAFPFSHFENPMYLGATMNFLGAALMQNNGVGVALSGWIALVYYVSTKYFENPFTEVIYGGDEDKKSV